jgi:hypothetical protein
MPAADPNRSSRRVQRLSEAVQAQPLPQNGLPASFRKRMQDPELSIAAFQSAIS